LCIVEKLYFTGFDMNDIKKLILQKENRKLEFKLEIDDDSTFTQVKFIITPPINNLNYVIILDGKNRRKKIITKRVV
jgi:hypothetical protein